MQVGARLAPRGDRVAPAAQPQGAAVAAPAAAAPPQARTLPAAASPHRAPASLPKGTALVVGALTGGLYKEQLRLSDARYERCAPPLARARCAGTAAPCRTAACARGIGRLRRACWRAAGTAARRPAVQHSHCVMATCRI